MLDPHRAHLDILANASGSVSPFYRWSVRLPRGWDLAPGQCIFNRVFHSHPACCHCLGAVKQLPPKGWSPETSWTHLNTGRCRHYHTLLDADWGDLFSYIDCTLTHAARHMDFKRCALFLSSSLVNKSYFYWEFLLQREVSFFCVSYGEVRGQTQSLQCFQNCLLCNLLLKDT